MDEKRVGFMGERQQDGRLYGTVKVGDRGQVVIPADARKELNIKPGDLLFVMSGRNRRGITMVKAEAMRELAERIMQGLESTKEETPGK
jgi:AbrB family looped-hinge helix DNA binding protein